MRMKMLLTFLAFFAMNVFAQTRSVTGTVYSATDNEPLIGATVKVKDALLATATDVEGNFTLSGVSQSAKYLEVSYVGYEPQTVAIS